MSVGRGLFVEAATVGRGQGVDGFEASGTPLQTFAKETPTETRALQIFQAQRE